jgi:hypothetical protein
MDDRIREVSSIPVHISHSHHCARQGYDICRIVSVSKVDLRGQVTYVSGHECPQGREIQRGAEQAGRWANCLGSEIEER